MKAHFSIIYSEKALFLAEFLKNKLGVICQLYYTDYGLEPCHLRLLQDLKGRGLKKKSKIFGQKLKFR